MYTTGMAASHGQKERPWETVAKSPLFMAVEEGSLRYIVKKWEREVEGAASAGLQLL